MFESNKELQCCEDGEGWSNGAQGDSSRHSQECEGPGTPGGGFAANQMSRPDGEALGAAHGRYGGGATRRQRQPVALNRAPSTGKVDGKRVEEGLQLCKGGRGNGIKD